MAEAPRVLVTGASGFIGRALVPELLRCGFRVRGTGRAAAPGKDSGMEWFSMEDLGPDADWNAALAGVDAVVHLAGLAHRFESSTPEGVERYDRVNHQATRALARAVQGHPTVRRFLFASTVRVHGDPAELPVRADSPFAPVTPYDRSKVDAETAIRELLDPARVRWAILRLALVYGPGNRGNMARLEGLLRRGLPVPAGRMPNRRSFLFVGNLVDAVLAYLRAEAPLSGRAWILADREPASTEDLVRAMGRAMGLHARVWHLPDWILGGSARIGDLCRRVGLPSPWNGEVRRKLLGDFWVDSTAIQEELPWSPPFTMEEGIQRTFGGIP